MRAKKVTPASTTKYVGQMYECENGDCTKYVFAQVQRIASVKSVGTYYYHSDHLATNSVITKEDASVGQEIYYYPYGEIKTSTGSIDVRHKFTDKEWDAETGLYYFGARYYDPKLAKFTSADTIIPLPFHPQTLNRYSYTYNNPLVFRDLDGHCSQTTVPPCVGAINGSKQGSKTNTGTHQNPVKDAQNKTTNNEPDTTESGALPKGGGGGVGPQKSPNVILGGDVSNPLDNYRLEIPGLPDYAKGGKLDIPLSPICPGGNWTGYGGGIEFNFFRGGVDLTYLKFRCLSDTNLIVRDVSLSSTSGIDVDASAMLKGVYVTNTPNSDDVAKQASANLSMGSIKLGQAVSFGGGENSSTVGVGYGVGGGLKAYTGRWNIWNSIGNE